MSGPRKITLNCSLRAPPVTSSGAHTPNTPEILNTIVSITEKLQQRQEESSSCIPPPSSSSSSCVGPSLTLPVTSTSTSCSSLLPPPPCPPSISESLETPPCIPLPPPFSQSLSLPPPPPSLSMSQPGGHPLSHHTPKFSQSLIGPLQSPLSMVPLSRTPMGLPPPPPPLVSGHQSYHNLYHPSHPHHPLHPSPLLRVPHPPLLPSPGYSDSSSCSSYLESPAQEYQPIVPDCTPPYNPQYMMNDSDIPGGPLTDESRDPLEMKPDLSETGEPYPEDGSSQTVQQYHSLFIKEGLKHKLVQKLEPGTETIKSLLTKPKKEREELTQEDEERRRRRRERNKVAATKCRNKKKERTILLVSEGETLEVQNKNLRQEITRLEAEKRRLNDILRLHESDCKRARTQSYSPSHQGNGDSDSYCLPAHGEPCAEERGAAIHNRLRRQESLIQTLEILQNLENDDIDKYERRMQDKKVKDENDQVIVKEEIDIKPEIEPSNFLSDEKERFAPTKDSLSALYRTSSTHGATGSTSSTTTHTTYNSNNTSQHLSYNPNSSSSSSSKSTRYHSHNNESSKSHFLQQTSASRTNNAGASRQLATLQSYTNSFIMDSPCLAL